MTTQFHFDPKTEVIVRLHGGRPVVATVIKTTNRRIFVSVNETGIQYEFSTRTLLEVKTDLKARILGPYSSEDFETLNTFHNDLLAELKANQQARLNREAASKAKFEANIVSILRFDNVEDYRLLSLVQEATTRVAIFSFTYRDPFDLLSPIPALGTLTISDLPGERAWNTGLNTIEFSAHFTILQLVTGKWERYFQNSKSPEAAITSVLEEVFC
jgi:hypothetical protein